MGIGAISLIGDAMQRWMTHLLLIAFFVRALVPAGYMSEFSSISDAGLKIVICTGVGAKTIVLDENGKLVPTPDNGHHDQPCAFSGLTAVALPALLSLATSAVEFGAVNFTPPTIVQRPPARDGPTLGSRGPPLIS